MLSKTIIAILVLANS